MNINRQAVSGGGFPSFDDDPNARLESVVQRLAHHPDAVARYVGWIGESSARNRRIAEA